MGYQKIHNRIKASFAGVTLDGGISLRQSAVIDNYGRGVSDAEFDALPRMEITNDWTTLSLEDLEEYACIPHLDAKGFRYYIPAYMSATLLHYDPLAMRVIETLGSLYPCKGSWGFWMEKYSLLTTGQREAIAFFLHELPAAVAITQHDRTITERALRNYWHQYL